MDSIQNIVEYYDELFPVAENQKEFFTDLSKNFNQPTKLLRINCSTGLFENQLSKEGFDVTGIDSVAELLKSANLRRRNQLMSLRFFLMSHMDITKFLGKGFYNIISILDSRILFISDDILLKKFFYDCKTLLSENGKFILNLINLNKFKSQKVSKLPTRKSIRVSMFTELLSEESNQHFINVKLETGNKKIVPVISNQKISFLSPDLIKNYALEAGFKSINFYATYKKDDFTEDSDYMIVEIS